MAHNRNASKYSVLPSGCEQGRGKTKSRSGKYSSRKTYLDDARVSPHSPRLLPTKFGVNSEPGLIQGNILRSEPFQSGSHGNISVPNLHIKSVLGQEKTVEVLGGWSPLSCEDKFKRIKNWVKSPILLSIDQNKELEIGPDLEKEGTVASTSSQPAPEVCKVKSKGPQKKQKVPKKNQRKGKGKPIGTDLNCKGTGSPNWSVNVRFDY
ncbi:hypothetical protein O181_116798 [Austropuccinia psidii MF-1]|uniref:Uncharacterized protein n=1 Tax=Austropuccinia psidii MF-1 TaxID=1389203 RepID=A0A9Q3PWW9_9BASI|nr:hypothetical protein [Austropuccinia psidii MF-1]